MALAGPVSNILLAVVAAALYGLVVAGLVSGAVPIGVANPVAGFLMTALSVNLSLAFFNLIPLPPLDGSSILVPFLKGSALQTYYRVQAYAMPILIVVLYLLPGFLGIDLIGAYFDLTVYPLGDALLRWALGFVSW